MVLFIFLPNTPPPVTSWAKLGDCVSPALAGSLWIVVSRWHRSGGDMICDKLSAVSSRWHWSGRDKICDEVTVDPDVRQAGSMMLIMAQELLGQSLNDSQGKGEGQGEDSIKLYLPIFTLILIRIPSQNHLWPSLSKYSFPKSKLLFKEFSHFRWKTCSTKCTNVCNRGGQIYTVGLP